MAETQLKGRNIGDGSVGRPDLNIATSGQAVITKIVEVANSGIRISSATGADSGTGDVGLAVDFTYLSTLYQAKLNGTGLVRMNGTTAGYDNTAYYHAGNLPAYQPADTSIFKFETFTADANTLTGNRSAFTYAVGAPHTGPMVHFGADNYGMQINGQYNGSGNAFSIRTRNGDIATWNVWRQLWHDGNFNPANYSLNGHTHDYATHRAEGTNFIDYAYGLYDAYAGGWRTSNDLRVLYAVGAGHAVSAGLADSSTLSDYAISAGTADTFSTGRTNYKGTTDGAVAGQLMWKHYGNGHTIFDASNSTSPQGTAINNTNAAVAWTGSFPTLMGWNGDSTYGVRVDSCRIADSATTAGKVINYTPHANTNASATANNFYTNYGYISLGPMNSGTAHIYTDMPSFYFNKDLLVLGNTVYHTGNLTPANYAVHRGEGTNYIDYARYVYNNGAYSGTGWTEPSDLGVRYANSAGTAGSTGRFSIPDGTRLADDKLPTDGGGHGMRMDFVNAGAVGSVGNYAGLMTICPWDGATASTGDASYQLAFAGTAINGAGVPRLRIRKGIDSTWNSFYDIPIASGLVATKLPMWDGEKLVTTGITYSTGFNSDNFTIRNEATSGAGLSSNMYFYAYNGTAILNTGFVMGSGSTYAYGNILPNAIVVHAAQSGGLALRSTSPPIRFYQGGALGNFTPPEVMTVSGTFVGIGYTSDPSVSRFAVNGNSYFGGNITSTGSGTFQGGGFHSLRCKKIINKDWTGNASAIISRFILRDFNYKLRPDHDRTLGFIIDEIPEEIREYALFGKDNDSINVYSFLGLSFKAHQETKTELEIQAEEIQSLKNRVKELEERRIN